MSSSLGKSISWTDAAGVTHVHCAAHGWSGRYGHLETVVVCPHCPEEVTNEGEEILELEGGEEEMPRKGESAQIPGTGEMFPQEKVAQIERWAIKYDELREEYNTVKEAMENAGFKLTEAMHANADKIERAQTEDGGEELRYQRGDVKCSVKRGKEKVNVRVGEKTKKSDEPEE